MNVIEMRLGGSALPIGGEGAVVTVGTFDGVHRGHREVLAEIVRRAKRSSRQSVLITFEPHPLQVIRPADAPALLTSLTEKVPLLADSGLDCLGVLPFTRTLQAYPAERFVTEILLGQARMRELVMGYDHGFGRGREGSVETMRELGEALGFRVDVVEAVEVDGQPVSSTRVRSQLAEGEVVAAARLLGRPYSLQGVVVPGARRGRELGFPTANLRLEEPAKMLPATGIYAVQAWVAGVAHPALLHLGPRPTFEGASATVEVHLLDWAGDLYQQTLQVDLCARLRDIVAYERVEDLVEQMHRDAEEGRAVLAGEKGDNACAP